jgi:glycosyltransferase involved in cell wall biosynthesis
MIKKLRIAIVVHGRFHAFDLAGALIDRGHDVMVFTNYPQWVAQRFDLSPQNVTSFWIHAIISRFFNWLSCWSRVRPPEAFLHRLFGSWAANCVARSEWDLIHTWSGISEEIIQKKASGALKGNPLIMVLRGSAHIRAQYDILSAERDRAKGCAVALPSTWMIEREEREYAGADMIRTISEFAHKSFLEYGCSGNKLAKICSGDPVQLFRPQKSVIDARIQRVMSNQKLRVVYVGALSFQKGLWDLKQILQAVGAQYTFNIVGPCSRDNKRFMGSVKRCYNYEGKVSQGQIKTILDASDLFIFPTLQEGYAQVLAQARSNAIPILTTTNCQGPEMISEGMTGWVLPIRDSTAFISRLQWCDREREELAKMIEASYTHNDSRTWEDTVIEFEALYRNWSLK